VGHGRWERSIISSHVVLGTLDLVGASHSASSEAITSPLAACRSPPWAVLRMNEETGAVVDATFECIASGSRRERLVRNRATRCWSHDRARAAFRFRSSIAGEHHIRVRAEQSRASGSPSSSAATRRWRRSPSTAAEPTRDLPGRPLSPDGRACRHAGSLRPKVAATEEYGSRKTSTSTNAARSSGESRSSTTRKASVRESAVSMNPSGVGSKEVGSGSHGPT